MLKAFHRHLILVPEEVVVEAVGGESCARGIAASSFSTDCSMRMARGERGAADVGPAVVPPAVAQVRRPQRILRELPFPFAIEQGMQRGTGRVGAPPASARESRQRAPGRRG